MNKEFMIIRSEMEHIFTRELAIALSKGYQIEGNMSTCTYKNFDIVWIHYSILVYKIKQ